MVGTSRVVENTLKEVMVKLEVSVLVRVVGTNDMEVDVSVRVVLEI